jgi:hypothetical protein
MNAVLAGFLSSAALLCLLFVITNVEWVSGHVLGGTIFFYLLAAETVLVGLFALWGVFRWFHYDTKRSLLARLNIGQQIILFPYPETVQSPFFALVHQHIRHASLIYPFGILCFIVWALGSLYLCVFPDEFYSSPNILWGVGCTICVFGMLLFWGTIFGHDQRNDSYKFLTRLGVHPGMVWWSRMLPPLPLYAFAGLCYLGAFLVAVAYEPFDNHTVTFWGTIWFGFLVWLAPMATGSFASIYSRSQASGVVITWGVTYLLVLWALYWVITFELANSPLWTTIPICFALLVASRLRASYWLREISTWRSRLIPLIPLFATLLVIVTALLCVYACSDVSLIPDGMKVGTQLPDGCVGLDIITPTPYN